MKLRLVLGFLLIGLAGCAALLVPVPRTIARPCSVSVPCSRTDDLVIPVTNLPRLGNHLGAGTSWIDIAYGGTISRVTDGATQPNRQGQSYATSSSAEQNLTSYDESLFVVFGNFPCFFSYAGGSTSLLGCVNIGNGEFGYSQADNRAYYSWTQNKLYRYVVATNPFSVTADASFNGGLGYFDPNNAQCLDGIVGVGQRWYTGDQAISSDDSTFIVDIGPGQDADAYAVIYNTTLGCRWANVQTWQTSQGWNTGLANAQNIVFTSGGSYATTGGLHNVQLDRSGSYGVLTVNGANIPQKLFWDIPTVIVDDTCSGCTSHFASDFGSSIWQHNTQSPGSGYALSTFTLGSDTWAAANDPTVDVSQWGNDDHISHANAVQGSKVPYVVAFQPGSGGNSIMQAWEDEIVAVTWDGSLTTYRFGKNWSSGYGGFNSAVRAVVSRQGSYVLFNSDNQLGNLDKGFGDGLNNDTCNHTQTAGLYATAGSCRIDVLLMPLWQGPPPHHAR